MTNNSPKFAFAVVTDSHIRPDEGMPQEEYPSNAQFNGRNRYVVQRLNQLGPDFVIHLGDFVHVIPGQPNYEKALGLAAEIFGGLKAPLFALPGNHDVGDKVNAWVPAPAVAEGSERLFEACWGPSYRSFNHKGCHFVLINAQILNSGLPAEEAQRRWLEADLLENKTEGRPLFIFSHYPLYLVSPFEAPHYDNIDQPARDWLLSLIRRWQPKAWFAGHVHNFFYDRCHQTDMVVVPSVSFIRPGFADLFDVSPEREYGRDDAAKLGFCLVHVDQTNHQFQLVRTFGASLVKGESINPSPASDEGIKNRLPSLGFFLRRSWSQPVELAMANLDEFVRKQARNDYWLWAVLELGVRRLRLPLADLANPASRERAGALVDLGFRLTFFSRGVPGPQQEALVENNYQIIAAWELIAPTEQFTEVVRRVQAVKSRVPVEVYFGPIRLPSLVDVGAAAADFDHFPHYGFSPGQLETAETLLAAAGAAEALSGFVFQSPLRAGSSREILQLDQWARRFHLRALVHGKLPRAGEGHAFTDDRIVANGVAEAAVAAACSGALLLMLDTLEDHDRGYYPRHGVVDRRYNPRPAYHVLRHLGAWLSTSGPFTGLARVDASDGQAAFNLVGATAPFALFLDVAGTAVESIWLDWDVDAGSGTGRWIDLHSGETTLVAWRREDRSRRVVLEGLESVVGGRYPALFSLG